MTRRKTLRRALARQWIAFGLVLFGGFAAMALLLLYMLEDAFIDRRLRDVGGTVATRSGTALPARFAVYAPDAAPAPIREQTHAMGEGDIREFRLPDRRYVHALRARGPDGTPFVLVHDVSDQLVVNAALGRAWPGLLAIALLLGLAAWAMAWAFMRRLSRQAADLVARVGPDGAPSRLHAYARDSAVAEFGELAEHLAQAWEERLHALARERETLAFLSHELRTPLQSARTSLALLEEQPDHALARRRLQRAVARLTRASTSILWLSGDSATAVWPPCRPLQPLLAGLMNEFAPLAAMRRQTISLDVRVPGAWPLPAEVAETVLANLLLNAIQHGTAGEITIEMEGARLCMRNPTAPHAAASGNVSSGLGLQLVRRILQRIGLIVAVSHDDETTTVVVVPEGT